MKLRTLLLCGLMAQMMAVAQTRIAVLTDTHVMAPSLLVSDGTAWQTYLASDRKLVDYSKDLFDVMVEKLKNDIQPDILLMTGDLSKDGEVASHEYVVSKLDELRSAGIPTLVIPGNHDLGTSNAKIYDGDNATSAEVATASSFASLYANYGYGSSSERDENSLSYVTEPFDGLVIIGIDSGTNGTISSETLSWVCQKASQAREIGKQVIAMMHYPLIPHFTNVQTFVSYAVVNDYETVRNALADAGIRVILTGHFHTSDIVKDFNADLSESIIDVNTGSLISYPCDYRVLTLSADREMLSVSTGSITELEGVDDFQTVAKDRLIDAVKKQISSKGTAYSIIAPTVATAFVCHAEGDEHNNATAQSTLSTLLGLASMASMAGMSSAEVSVMRDMANSMLRDLSQYNVAGRENQTDDRTLAISLDPINETVTIPAGGYMSFCSDKRLDFSQTNGIDAYIVTAANSANLTLEKVSIVPSGTGLILKGSPNTSYSLKATSSSPESFTQLLTGTLSATVAPSGAYVLSEKSGVIGFYPVNSGITIPKGKAYLP